MIKSLWTLRLLFLALCTAAGYAVSQNSEFIDHGGLGLIIGFGLGWLVIAVDEMTKGLSIRTFSAAGFGLATGALIAWLVEQSHIFTWAEEKTQWVIRLAMFLGFSYIGMILAMRSNKEDFTLVIPFVRFTPRSAPKLPLLLDTSIIIDGRIIDVLPTHALDGILIVPRFVLKELQQVADSSDPIKRGKGRRGLDILTRLQEERKFELKIHEAEIPGEDGVDAKLLALAKHLEAKLLTNDYNLSKLAELQNVPCVNFNELASVLKPVLLPGDRFNVRIVREGRERGQGVGFMPDGTMIVVAGAQSLIGQDRDVQVVNVLQTGAGKMVFAELHLQPAVLEAAAAVAAATPAPETAPAPPQP
jgi:uncharacterized protein YacL